MPSTPSEITTPNFRKRAKRRAKGLSKAQLREKVLTLRSKTDDPESAAKMRAFRNTLANRTLNLTNIRDSSVPENGISGVGGNHLGANYRKLKEKASSAEGDKLTALQARITAARPGIKEYRENRKELLAKKLPGLYGPAKTSGAGGGFTGGSGTGTPGPAVGARARSPRFVGGGATSPTTGPTAVASTYKRRKKRGTLFS